MWFVLGLVVPRVQPFCLVPPTSKEEMSAFHKIAEVAIKPLPVRIGYFYDERDSVYYQVYQPTVANTQLMARDLARRMIEVMAKW